RTSPPTPSTSRPSGRSRTRCSTSRAAPSSSPTTAGSSTVWRRTCSPTRAPRRTRRAGTGSRATSPPTRRTRSSGSAPTPPARTGSPTGASPGSECGAPGLWGSADGRPSADVGGRVLGYQIVGGGAEGAPDGREVLGTDDVDEVPAYALDVHRCRPLQQRAPGGGQHGLDATTVGVTGRPCDQVAPLQALDGVGDPAAGVAHAVGQRRHPQPAVRSLGQPDEDLVLWERDAEGVAQFAVQLRQQQGAADDVRAPGQLLVGGEPADGSGAHGFHDIAE